jgi:hypothetical protein
MILKKEKGLLPLQNLKINLKENLKTIKYLKGNIPGKIKTLMLVHLKIIKCMEKEYTLILQQMIILI